MLRPDYPVRTPRLVLRPLSPNDLDPLHAFHQLPEVARYLYQEPRNRAEVSVLLQGKIAGSVLPAEGKALCPAAELAETGNLGGDCTLFWLSRAYQQGEIGFIFHPASKAAGSPPRQRRPCSGSGSRVWACTGSSAGAIAATADRPGSWSVTACALRRIWWRTSSSRGSGPTR